MKRVQKIIAILLLPVMFISFTGAKVHIHFCKDTGNFYSDIHLPDYKNDSENHSFCNEESVMNETCCMDTCTENNDPYETCCIDIQQERITDENYKSSVFSIKINIAEIELHYADAVNSYHDFSLLRSNITNDKPYLPPRYDSRTVLIL